jgi:hypothetical protein
MDQLARAIEELHDATALWEATVRMRQTFGRHVVCEDKVQMFRLLGHPSAQLCFAWQSETELGKKETHVVLRLPPVDSAEDAVRSVIAQSRAAL